MACSPLRANWSDPFFRRCRCSPTVRSTYLRSKKIPLVTSSAFTKSKPKTLQGSVEHLSSNYHYFIRNWGKILLQGLFQCFITNFMTLHRGQLILLRFVSKVHRYKNWHCQFDFWPSILGPLYCLQYKPCTLWISPCF